MPVSDGSAKSNNGGQNEAQAYHLSRHIISTGVSSQQAYRLNSTGNDRVPIEWLLVIRDIDAEELIKKSRQQDDCRRTAFRRVGTRNNPLQITDSVALKKRKRSITECVMRNPCQPKEGRHNHPWSGQGA
jgi:hypothetical protein